MVTESSYFMKKSGCTLTMPFENSAKSSYTHIFCLFALHTNRIVCETAILYVERMGLMGNNISLYEIY